MPASRPLAERLWEKVVRDGDCWPFVGARDPKGYGRISVRNKALLTQRVAWELANGPIPEGMHVLHRCDNPPCVNPAHLFLGSNHDNMQDKVRKGRARGPLHRAQVIEARRLAASGMPTEELANKYAVSPLSMAKVIRRETWNWVP